MIFDVFNGDADGILSLLQLRKANPQDSKLITGVKRDISLLKKVSLDQASHVNVLDISMEKNVLALTELLEKEIPVFYADHHRSGDIPASSLLQAHIDPHPNTCTALIIDNILSGEYHLWAIAAAFGDNLNSRAFQLAKERGLSEVQAKLLQELGVLINYNGYGASVADLHYDPAELFRLLMTYDSPFDVIDDDSSPFNVLKSAYSDDITRARSEKPQHNSDILMVTELPNSAWARRVSGVFGNMLANESPNKAHAVLTKNLDGDTYTVSLRAPLNNKQGAGDICASFATGGGRAAAAGINALPINLLSEFIDTVEGGYR
ncbi:DHH family phosphoesterase [Shewanella sp. Scap07]|uniref:DHH family phosphoesterase n=1 Tax=Shewanella sp. Scap07 TaxID=2589987 RepID=UPI0015BF88B2|nr:DHH family phosphoesterase [Shewanella sp. Scap07]QLE86070.1 DHH family phosphoesterase [Shewanella sp. Scap07]